MKQSHKEENADILKGWQQIVEFLGQPVSVAERWAREGMPVERKGRFCTRRESSLVTGWDGVVRASRFTSRVKTQTSVPSSNEVSLSRGTCVRNKNQKQREDLSFSSTNLGALKCSRTRANSLHGGVLHTTALVRRGYSRLSCRKSRSCSF
jgi:hypothetical protein